MGRIAYWVSNRVWLVSVGCFVRAYPRGSVIGEWLRDLSTWIAERVDSGAAWRRGWKGGCGARDARRRQESGDRMKSGSG